MRVSMLMSMLLLVAVSCMFQPPRPPNTAPTSQATEVVATVADPADSAAPSGFVLTSSEVANGGALPATYTCDGASATLPLRWANAPADTVSYAIIMHHMAPDAVHWYWVLYDIPADITQLTQNSTGVGTLGSNSVNDRNEYAPPCSKGPGPKTYTYTVYALSAPPQLTSDRVDRDTLLAAIADTTLASATLDVVYSRP